MKSNLLLTSVVIVLSLLLVQCDDLAHLDLEKSDKKGPKKVQLISPVSGSTGQSTEVELLWEHVADGVEYRVMVSESSKFDSLLVDDIVDQASYTTALSAGKTYYWKIQPFHEEYYGKWSDIWFYTTASVESEPVSVDLVAPANGSTVPGENVTFEWTSAGQSADYNFQLAADTSFTSQVRDTVVQSTTVDISGLQEDSEFHWRVTPVLESATGTWSETGNFRTDVQLTSAPAPTSDFVTASNSDFMLDGSRFRYAGTNAYHLPNYQKVDPGAVERAFDSFEKAGITVVRMWAFYDGPAQYDNDITIQPEPGQYNEEGLVALDKVIARGKEAGVRFILPFVNYWSQLGGVKQYNTWDGNPEGGMQHFMTDPDTKEWFQDYISMLLNRVNTVTGVAYKNEPAIFAWEIMNEGRFRGADPTVLRDWYQETAQYIKSIDPNHMVSTGEEGFDEGTPAEYSSDQYSNTYVLRTGEGTSYVMNTAIPEIDYGTAHWYPAEFGWFISEWGLDPVKDENLLKAQHAWLKDHIAIAESHGKPFLLGEYGYPGWADERVVSVYRDLWEQAEGLEMDGSLIWQFTADHIKCYEYGGNICYPAGRADEALYNEFKTHIDNMNAQ